VLEISSYLALAITGGLLLQVPLGRLSDAFDRRLVAAAASLAFMALALALGPAARTPWFFPLWLLLGGFMSVIYPICVAHANDRMPPGKAVAVSGRLILISGVGSALGPLLGAGVMEVLGIRGLFSFLAGVAALFACFALLRTTIARSPATKGRKPFRLLQTIFSHDPAHAP
jgi:MFS family permease